MGVVWYFGLMKLCFYVATGIFSHRFYIFQIESDSVHSPFVTYWFEDFILTNTGFAARSRDADITQVKITLQTSWMISLDSSGVQRIIDYSYMKYLHESLSK